MCHYEITRHTPSNSRGITGPDSEKACRLYAPHSAKWKTDVESPPVQSVQRDLSKPKAHWSVLIWAPALTVCRKTTRLDMRKGSVEHNGSKLNVPWPWIRHLLPNIFISFPPSPVVVQFGTLRWTFRSSANRWTQGFQGLRHGDVCWPSVASGAPASNITKTAAQAVAKTSSCKEVHLVHLVHLCAFINSTVITTLKK